MTSPLKLLENAELTFYQAQGEFGVDDDGNAIAPALSVVIKAFLKTSSTQANRGGNEELDAESIARTVMTGYCIDPLFLPASILVGAKADAVILLPQNDATVRRIEGEFILSPAISPVALARNILGDKLAGVFYQRNVWGIVS